jgi:hypothetical protein
MLVLKATDGNGYKIQFHGNLIMIVGTIKTPEKYKFMLLNKPGSQLFIPLKLRSSGNVTVYETVNTIYSEPLVMSIRPLSMTLSMNTTIPVPKVPGKKMYYLTTTENIPVQTYLTKYKLQCIGKQRTGKKYQYAFYQY